MCLSFVSCVFLPPCFCFSKKNPVKTPLFCQFRNPRQEELAEVQGLKVKLDGDVSGSQVG